MTHPAWLLPSTTLPAIFILGGLFVLFVLAVRHDSDSKQTMNRKRR